MCENQSKTKNTLNTIVRSSSSSSPTHFIFYVESLASRFRNSLKNLFFSRVVDWFDFDSKCQTYSFKKKSLHLYISILIFIFVFHIFMCVLKSLLSLLLRDFRKRLAISIFFFLRSEIFFLQKESQRSHLFTFVLPLSHTHTLTLPSSLLSLSTTTYALPALAHSSNSDSQHTHSNSKTEDEERQNDGKQEISS